jgi:two-component system, cell cycle response regulator DivK
VSQGSLPSILLVEPPEDDRPMYAEFLRGQGFAVTEVDSTDAAWSAAPAADLIITGIRLAGSFDGIELVRRIRDDKRTKGTPVIVLTACGFEPDQARAFAAGCDRFVPKPCVPEDLLRQAEDLIGRATRLRAEARDARARGAMKLRAAKALLERSADLVTRRRPRAKHR